MHDTGNFSYASTWSYASAWKKIAKSCGFTDVKVRYDMFGRRLYFVFVKTVSSGEKDSPCDDYFSILNRDCFDPVYVKPPHDVVNLSCQAVSEIVSPEGALHEDAFKRLAELADTDSNEWTCGLFAREASVVKSKNECFESLLVRADLADVL